MSDIAERNRTLAFAMNRKVWNERRLDRIPDYFTSDFVADYIKPSGRSVKFDEIVIIKVTESKFSHQWGVSDSLLTMQQIRVIPDPAGFSDA